MIKEPLSRAAAEQIFNQEAICFGDRDAIPLYRMVELFGEAAGYYIERNMGYEKYLVGGRDYNARGSGSAESPIIDYFYKEGFIKVVTNHNYLYSVAAHAESGAGKFWDELMKQRNKRIDREDADVAAKDETKRQERKTKREAAKATKAERGNADVCV